MRRWRMALMGPGPAAGLALFMLSPEGQAILARRRFAVPLASAG